MSASARRQMLLAMGIAAVLGCAAPPGPRAAESPQPDAAFGRAIAAAGSMPRLHSLLVSHAGELVLERYFNGYDRNDVANVKSVSKSIVSALVGIAIEQGHIAGVDQTIDRYFPEQLTGADARARITIEDLLAMRAGLASTSNRNYGAWVLSPNWIEFALGQRLLDPPGARMQYSTGNTHLLSAILTRTTGRSTLAYARDVLAEPLGFQLAAWPRDPQGIYFGGNDMELTPRQMLAFGNLYLNDGAAGGRQLIPREWIAASLQPRVASPREFGRYYGYGWWIRTMAGYRTPYAWGFGGQLIVLVPELELVVVTTSSSKPGPDRRAHTRGMYDFLEYDLIEPIAKLRLGRQGPIAEVRVQARL